MSSTGLHRRSVGAVRQHIIWDRVGWAMEMPAQCFNRHQWNGSPPCTRFLPARHAGRRFGGDGNTVYGTCEFGAPFSASALTGRARVAVIPHYLDSVHCQSDHGIRRHRAIQRAGTDSGGIHHRWQELWDGSTNFSTQNPSTYILIWPFSPASSAINNNNAINYRLRPVIAVIYPSSISTALKRKRSRMDGQRVLCDFAECLYVTRHVRRSIGFVRSPGIFPKLSPRPPERFIRSRFGSIIRSARPTMIFRFHGMDRTSGYDEFSVTAWTNIQLTYGDRRRFGLQFGYRNDTAYFVWMTSASIRAALGIAGISCLGRTWCSTALPALRGPMLCSWART